MKLYHENTSLCHFDCKKCVSYAFPYHVGDCALDVSFSDLKCNVLKELLIGLILSTQSAAVSFYNFWCTQHCVTTSSALSTKLNLVAGEVGLTSWSTLSSPLGKNRNTKIWCTIDALGAIFTMFTIIGTFPIFKQHWNQSWWQSWDKSWWQSKWQSWLPSSNADDRSKGNPERDSTGNTPGNPQGNPQIKAI